MKYLAIFFSLLLIFSILTTSYYYSLYHQTLAEEEKLSNLLALQNQAIKQLEIDTENFKATQALKEQELKARYESIKPEQGVDRLLEEFFSRGSK